MTDRLPHLAPAPSIATGVAILGAGTAGMRAYRAVTARDPDGGAILIDPGPLGTTCARVGCMPSKLLIAAADAAHAAREAWRFGADVARSPVVDGAAVLERVRRERDRFVGFVLTDVEPWNRLAGRARFVDAHTVAVTAPDGTVTTVRAKAFVLATGSRPRALPLLDRLGDLVLTSDQLFELPTLPASIAVFGPGIIGLELGQALARLGVRVRIFGVGGFVGPLTDPVVKEAARAALAAEVPLRPDATVHSVRRVPSTAGEDEVIVRFVGDDGTLVEERFARVLSAVGRAPNVEGLGLAEAGVAVDARGVPVFDPATMQCGDTPVFIAGDVNGDRPLLHEAADEGLIAGENAARFPDVAAGLRRAPLAVVFTDPQIAMVGASHKELAGREIVVGSVSFADQGRSRVMLANRGLLHLYADPLDGGLLGAELCGPRAEHLAHLLAWSVQQRLTVARMLEMPFYHPVIEEGLRTALRDAASQLAARAADAA
jgi:dihydrolipoamide dehydrogenase